MSSRRPTTVYPPKEQRRRPTTVYLSTKQHYAAESLALDAGSGGSISKVLATGLTLALDNPPRLNGRKARKAGEIKTTVLLSPSLHAKAKRAFSKGSMQDLLTHGLELLVNGSRSGSGQVRARSYAENR